MKRQIGVLAIDTGDYHAYVGYFSDPKRLQTAVDKLNAERLDANSMEAADAEARVEWLNDVPAVIDDDFLDLLAGMLNEAGPDIETAKDRQQRLDEAAEEAEGEFLKPIVPAPGQIGMDT